MSPKVDWGQVEERTFEPLPRGVYEARLSEYSNEGVGPSGHEYYQVVYTVDDGEYVGRKLFDSYSLAPKALFALKRALLALGVSPERVTDESDEDIEDIFEELIGEPCRLQVKTRNYKDPDTGEVKVQNDVQKVLPAGFSV